MNYHKLYELKQDSEESAGHFFGHGHGHHARVDVSYGHAQFSAHCDSADALHLLLGTLLLASRTENAPELHPVDVKLAWVYADDN